MRHPVGAALVLALTTDPPGRCQRSALRQSKPRRQSKGACDLRKRAPKSMARNRSTKSTKDVTRALDTLDESSKNSVINSTNLPVGGVAGPSSAGPENTTVSKRTKAALNDQFPMDDHDCASLEIHTGAARGRDSESGDTDRATYLD